MTCKMACKLLHARNRESVLLLLDGKPHSNLIYCRVCDKYTVTKIVHPTVKKESELSFTITR